jgi:hypothetical protein
MLPPWQKSKNEKNCGKAPNFLNADTYEYFLLSDWSQIIGEKLRVVFGSKTMASLSRAGSRIGKAKVRFDLKVKVKNMFLPKVANGAKIFVIMERGKTHKSWTKPHGYTTSTQVNANKNYVDEWADECLQVPITLYRSQQGIF